MYTIDDLRAVLEALPPAKRDTAADLIRKGARWGLSERAARYVHDLTCLAKNETVARPTVQVGSLEAVIALFDKAKKHLKYPKIILNVPGSRTVLKLSVAGDKAKVPGSVNVTDDGSFRCNEWYGRITTDGQFHPSAKAGSVPDLIGVLTRFAADPARVAAEFGHLSGNCCFCMLPLTDERSTDAGYGPVCASNWGLAWGNKTKGDERQGELRAT